MDAKKLLEEAQARADALRAQDAENEKQERRRRLEEWKQSEMHKLHNTAPPEEIQDAILPTIDLGAARQVDSRLRMFEARRKIMTILFLLGASGKQIGTVFKVRQPTVNSLLNKIMDSNTRQQHRLQKQISWTELSWWVNVIRGHITELRGEPWEVAEKLLELYPYTGD